MPLDKGKPPFTLPKLPYAEDALAPVVSAKTISFHYGKHHKAYVDKLNELIEGTAYAGMTIEEIVKKSAKDEKGKAIFNNAAQAWNHDFYWHSMAPKGGAPAGKIKKALEDSFGSVEDFNKAFKAAAVGQFGFRRIRGRVGMPLGPPASAGGRFKTGAAHRTPNSFAKYSCLSFYPAPGFDTLNQ